MGGAEADRGLEIRGHTHTEASKPVAPGDFGQEREVQRRFLVERRDAHQPLHRQSVFVAAGGDELVGPGREDSGLLGFFAGVDLDQTGGASARPIHLAGESGGELRPVHGLYRVEQRDRIARLVGLERADQVQRGVGSGLAERRPLGLRLLHPVLAEGSVTGRYRLPNRLRRMGLRDRHERYRSRLPAGGGHRGGYALLDRPQPRRDVDRLSRKGFRSLHASPSAAANRRHNISGIPLGKRRRGLPAA